MRQSVIEKFEEFSVGFESHVPYMYLDVLGYVTTGVGNLIDTVRDAQALPWKIAGRSATKDEIATDWHIVKQHQDLRNRHHKQMMGFTRCRLTDDAISELVRSKLLSNEKLLRKDFKHWDDFTADAQLAICSMAWALGAGFAATWKQFAKAANTLVGDNGASMPDYVSMKATCKINPYDGPDPATGKKPHPKFNPGVIPRNKANELCLENARIVAEAGMDPEVLHWPNLALPSPRTVPAPEGEGDLQLAAVKAFGVRTDEIGDIGREARRELSGDTEPAPPPDFDAHEEKDTRPDNPKRS